MKVLKYFLSVLICFLLTGCPEGDYKSIFVFENSSSKDVLVYLGGISRENGGCLYPDTLLPDSEVGIIFPRGVVRGYSFNTVPNADTLCLFIVDKAIVDTIPWKKIHDENIILKRYDIAITDFVRLNWEITYPPNEAMKNIKMFPAYGEN